MTGAAKRKGDDAEREVAAIISDLLGSDCRRALGAGRSDDIGDIFGLPEIAVQVANWADALRAIREKPVEAEVQRANAGAAYVATFVRLRGGVWRVVLTPQQWATYARAVME